MLSVLDHLRQEYHPKDVVLTAVGDKWRAVTAGPGIETEPGLIVYRSSRRHCFSQTPITLQRVSTCILSTAPHRVNWLVLDLVSMDDLDYTGGLTLAAMVKRLQGDGVTVCLAAADDVAVSLGQLGIAQDVGRDRVFDSVQDAVEAYRARSA